MSAPPAPTHPDVTVVPVTEETWHLAEELFDSTGVPSGCWCSYFLMTAQDFRGSSLRRRRQHAKDRVGAGQPFGLVAVVDSRPRAWVAVSPREDNLRLRRSIVARVPADEDTSGTWSITCFYVQREARRGGLTEALIAAAVDHATRNGARVVEAYPADTHGARLSPDDLYHGVLQSFLDAGFELVERRGVRRALVRKTVSRR